MSANANEMHGVDGKVIIVTGSGRGVGRGMALHLGEGGARIVVAEWKEHLLTETCAELTRLGRREPRRRVRHPGEGPDRRDGRADRRALRPRRRAHQQRADVPAARADRRRERRRRRRVLPSGVKGPLWAMQAVYPHMKAQGLGSHRQLRVVDGHHRRHRFRRVQRVEGSDPRDHAHRGARMGRRRHHRQRDRAGRGDPSRRGRASRARAIASSSRTAR